MPIDPHPTPEGLKAQHTRQAIADRIEERAMGGTHLRDFIYGAIDGTVTTFAVVAGVRGAELAAGIVVILGVANLVADGVSMAVSNYLGTRADEQIRDRFRRMEERHIEKIPEGEREEIRQIFAAKGFTGRDLERAVGIITSDRKRWVDTMLTEEFGFQLDGPNPLRAAAITFIAFITVGSLPLLVYIYALLVPQAIGDPFPISAAMTGVAFFAVGACKSRFIDESWYVSGLKVLGVGAIAAACAFAVGVLLKGLA